MLCILDMIKQKLKNYILTNDITLQSLFSLVDTDSNQVLTLVEFLQKMKMLYIDLNDDELRNLYKLLDKRNTGEVTYQDFIHEFPEISSKSTF